MKRSLLYLLLFVFSIETFAQKHCTAKYDFSNPTKLTPSITPAEGNGQEISTTNMVFKEGDIEISFRTGTLPLGSSIATNIDEGTTNYYLRVFATATMSFIANNGAVLDSIRFSKNTIIGDLALAKNEPGFLDPEQGYRFWKNNSGKDVSHLNFFNNFATSEIDLIDVYYTIPSDILVPTLSISSGATVPEFSSIELDFGKEMHSLSISGITLKTTDGTKSWKVFTSINGSKVILSVAEPITTDCNLVLDIPSSSFESNDGFQNKALHYTFNVVEARNVFNYVSADPQLGKVKLIPNTFTIAFPDIVGHVSSDNITLYQNGEPYRIVKMSCEEKLVKFTIQNTDKDITVEGEYELTVPEGRIFNVMYGSEYAKYNKNFKLKYIVTSDIDEPKPGPEPEPSEDSEVMKAAKLLLTSEGVGYPGIDSDARINLKNLVEAETVPTDEALTQAMESFYKETKIELPSNKKYYQIASVNSEGNRYWLTYSNGAVILTKDNSHATPFMAVANEDGTVSFTTNGKYLHVLAADSRYTGTSDKNITEEYSSKVNNLKLTKLAIEGKEAKKMLGLLTVYGGLGVDKVSKEDKYAYALVDHSNGNVLTQAEYEAKYFEADLTNAFSVTEIDVPVELACTLTPELVKTNKEILVLTFKADEAVTLSQDAKPYFRDLYGNVVAQAPLTKSEDLNNAYLVSLTSLSNGYYDLVMPKGTFTCVVDGMTKNVSEITKRFEINDGGGSGSDGGFDYTYSIWYKYSPRDFEGPVKDVELNNLILTLYPLYDDIIPDPKKQVRLVNGNYPTDVLAYGHFEKYIIPEEPELKAIRLILDKPIVEGSLAPETYGFLFEAGTIGDSNFGKYLEDKMSVDPRNCKVNPEGAAVYVDVDNEKASSVNCITIDTDRELRIVDLLGRKVNKMKKGNMYIVNGKKFIK